MPKGTTKANGQKDSLDRFYTKSEVALQCLNQLQLNRYNCIIEPSAGDGAFSDLIQNCFAYDISPNKDTIQQADWFALDKSQFKVHSDILVVGNPPFGQQNTVAIAFFNEAAKFSDTIAFILPLSFKKDSIQNRLDLNFSLVKEYELSNNSFIFNGADYAVPCMFQIWERTPEPRKRKKLRTTTNLFAFVEKGQADFRIQRVGGNAGKASFDLDRAAASNYFIKNNSSLSNSQLVELINELKFPSIEFTVGPKSLSKGELIATIEESMGL